MMGRYFRLCTVLVFTTLTATTARTAAGEESSGEALIEVPQLLVRFAANSGEGRTADEMVGLLQASNRALKAGHMRTLAGNPDAAQPE